MKKLIIWDGMTIPHIGADVNPDINPVLAWQICHTVKDGRKTTCDGVATVYAVSLADVYAVINTDIGCLADDDDTDDDGNIIADRYYAYPLATGIEDACGIDRLARYARRKAWKWDIANNSRALSALNRSTWDVEDETGDALLAVIESMDANPDAPMIDHYHYARAVIERKKRALYRKNGQEYNPARELRSPYKQGNTPTDAHMDKLVRTAFAVAGLTETQENVVKTIAAGIGQKEACELTGCGKPLYYRHKYAGLYKLISAMVALDAITDTDGNIKYWDMSEYGLTPADIMDAWERLAEKKYRYSNKYKKKKD